MLHRGLLLAAATGAAAFSQPGRVPVSMQRAASPAMQFQNPFGNLGKKPGGDAPKSPAPASKAAWQRRNLGSGFYDDEKDTVSQDEWKPDFADNGEVDLANVGTQYYLAFIPFLLFVALFSSGGFSFGYSSSGNF